MRNGWLILGIVTCLVAATVLLALRLNVRVLPAVDIRVVSAENGQPLERVLAVSLTQRYPVTQLMSLRGRRPLPVNVQATLSDAQGRLSLPGVRLISLAADDLQEVYLYRPGYLTIHYRRGRGEPFEEVRFARTVELRPGTAVALAGNLDARVPDTAAVSLLGRVYWFAYYLRHVEPETYRRQETMFRQIHRQFQQDQAALTATFSDPNQVDYLQRYLTKLQRVLQGQDPTTVEPESPSP